MSNITTFLLLYPYLIFINGVEDDLPANGLSIFSFVRIILALSTAYLKLQWERVPNIISLGVYFKKNPLIPEVFHSLIM